MAADPTAGKGGDHDRAHWRFKSGLRDEDVLHAYQARAPLYREVPGLVQKYYLRFSISGEHGAVYLWDSEGALKGFRQSDFARSISDVYRVQRTSEIQIADVVMALRPDSSGRAR